MATNPYGIDYVIVVMLENRSYDNVLGGLYNPANSGNYQYPPPGQTNLNGLGPDNSNPNPSGGPPILAFNPTSPTVVDGTSYPPTAMPIYDPGEWFGDMAQQITGATSLPTSNPYPYNPYSAGLMQGFTFNYANVGYTGDTGKFKTQQQPPSSALADVMSYMTPAQVPVTSFLAANYAVCDQWFASVPSQTYVNRAFALTAAPGMGTQVDIDGVASWVNDWVYVDPVGKPNLYTVPSLLSQLDLVLDGSPNWKVYFHDMSIAMQTVAYVATQAAQKQNVNVSTFDTSDYDGVMPWQLQEVKAPPPLPNTFLQDLAAGTLPPFSWIEPRYFLDYATFETDLGVQYPPNSNHPGAAVYPALTGLKPLVTNADPPIDVMSGELFLMQLYNALVQSTIWQETLLIVTYDEHGGMYDHVPPPFATPPGVAPFPSIPPAQDPYDPAVNGPDSSSPTTGAFDFNVLGGRVPAIVVSPLIAQGSTIRDPNGAPFDHTSIVKTVWDLFNLSGSPPTLRSLTARDAAAPSLAGFLSTGANNPTGAFSGTLLAAPSFMVFSYELPGPETVYNQALQASDGGTNPPTATLQDDAPTWLTISSATSGNLLTVTVGLDTANVPTTAGTSTATIQIASTNNATPATIDVVVTLVVSSP